MQAEPRDFLRHHLRQGMDMLAAAALVLRPREQITPADFAARYRVLKVGTTAQPGRWSNDYFPVLADVMNSVAEAIREGKTGVVLMKSAQGGGSEAMINALAWLLTYYPGPVLYLISKDEVAREFCRERFSYINETCEPLARKSLTGRGSGELVHVKRYIDGKLVVQGGKSVLNLQSFAYRHVFIDEADSLQNELDEQDPIALAEARTRTYSGNNRIMVVFAHPTTKDRGAGKLYYESSDQRREFVTCPHCGGEFNLTFAHVRCVQPKDVMPATAERDPDCYHYFAPCCGAEITDAQRWNAIRTIRQKSTLPPDVAKKKPWIGIHFGQLAMPNVTLRAIVQQHIDALENEPKRRVFVNKGEGDTYEAELRKTSTDDWRKLVVVARRPDDPRAYQRGTVPPGVSFLTCGQDSHDADLYWTVWGWGLRRRVDKFVELCGWLIDFGIVTRPVPADAFSAGELHALLDSALYRRRFVCSYNPDQFHAIQLGGHDSGYAKSQIAIYAYCADWQGLAVPVKGGADTSESTHPAVRLGSPQKFVLHGVVEKTISNLLVLNTYVLKTQWYGLVNKRIEVFDDESELKTQEPRLRTAVRVPVLTLPLDDGKEDYARFLAQSSAEVLTRAERGRGEIWKARRADEHFGDCNILAYACAVNLNPFQQGLTFEEIQQRTQAEETRRAATHAPSREGGWKIGR